MLRSLAVLLLLGVTGCSASLGTGPRVVERVVMTSPPPPPAPAPVVRGRPHRLHHDCDCQRSRRPAYVHNPPGHRHGNRGRGRGQGHAYGHAEGRGHGKMVPPKRGHKPPRHSQGHAGGQHPPRGSSHDSGSGL